MVRPPLAPIAALAAAGLLGGGAALGVAAALGDLGGTTTTVVQREAPALNQKVSSSGNLSINEIYRRSSPGVVQITSTTKPVQVTSPFFGAPFAEPPTQALGSGFVIDKDGHIVTNYHVVQGAAKIEVSFSNQTSYKAKVVGVDASTDLAVLKVGAPARALTPLPLGDSDRVQVGDEVVAIGNPFGLDRTATAGIVSAIQRRIQAPSGFPIEHVIQTDAPINHGNSGGPLIDAHGNVIGVNSQIETGGSGTDGNVGIGFAIPSNTVKNVAAQIIKNGKVEHAFLGITLASLDAQVAQLFHLPVTSGVLVQSVQPGSGAAKAGIKGGGTQVTVAGESYRMGGDIIVAVDGKPIASADALRAAVSAHKPGDTIELTIYRGQKKLTVSAKLGRLPSTASG
jgi:S1-C subfamily serine protease